MIIGEVTLVFMPFSGCATQSITMLCDLNWKIDSEAC